MCQHMGVMYAGKIVELGDTKALFTATAHPYTPVLLSAIPVFGKKDEADEKALRAEPPNP